MSGRKTSTARIMSVLILYSKNRFSKKNVRKNYQYSKNYFSTKYQYSKNLFSKKNVRKKYQYSKNHVSTKYQYRKNHFSKNYFRKKYISAVRIRIISARNISTGRIMSVREPALKVFPRLWLWLWLSEDAEPRYLRTISVQKIKTVK